MFLLISCISSFCKNNKIEKNRPGTYELPALLETAGGEEIRTALQWTHARRPEILRIFQEEIYGTDPVPLFLEMNFYGNHTIHTNPGISLTRSRVSNKPELCITGNRATEESRGERSYRSFGHEDFSTSGTPALNEPRISDRMAYHIRSGEHDLLRFDWEQYLDFTDVHFRIDA